MDNHNVRDCLDLDEEGKLCIPPGIAATECIAVLGKRGSGKSNSVARILEQLMKHGATVSIIDPHNEYAGLRQQFPVYIAGTDFDIPVQPQHGGLLARWVYENNASVILAIREFSTEDRHRFLLAYVTTLQRLHMANRRPHMLVIEEAHNFIPQSGGSPLKSALKQVATEGRKFGLGVLISDQRSANVDKTVLEMSDIKLLHRATGVNDLKTYEDISDMPGAKQIARKLRIGEAIAILDYDVDSEPVKVQIKRRDTPHGGDTPELVGVFSEISQKSLTSLAALLAAHTEDEESDQAREIKSLKKQIEEREQRLAEAEGENKRLRADNELLSKLKIVMPQMTQDLPSVLDVERITTQQIVAANKGSADQLVMTSEAKSLVNGAWQSDPTASHGGTSGGGKSEAIKQLILPVPTSPPTPVATDPKSGDEYQSPKAAARAFRKQEREFAVLLDNLGKLPKFHRPLLKFLIDNSHQAYTAEQLARWTGFSKVTIKSSPPLQLMELGLIAREGLRGNYRYRSTARALVERRFPDLPPDALIGQILKACEK